MSKIVQETDKITSFIENEKEKSVLEQKSLPNGGMSIKHSYLNKETGEEIIKEWNFDLGRWGG